MKISATVVLMHGNYPALTEFPIVNIQNAEFPAFNTSNQINGLLRIAALMLEYNNINFCFNFLNFSAIKCIYLVSDIK